MPVTLVETVVVLVPPLRLSPDDEVVSSGRSPKFPLNSISIYVPLPEEHAVLADELSPSVVILTVTFAIVGSSSNAYFTDFVTLRRGTDVADCIPRGSVSTTVDDVTEETVKFLVSAWVEEYN